MSEESKERYYNAGISYINSDGEFVNNESTAKAEWLATSVFNIWKECKKDMEPKGYIVTWDLVKDEMLKKCFNDPQFFYREFHK